jgi:hypothetical protein
MRLEVAIVKNDVSRAVGDHRGNLEDKQASDAGVCIKAALQRRRDSGRDSRARRY